MAGTFDDTNPNAMDNTGATTVFFDGFNGTSLDRAKWPITYGGTMYWNDAFRWDNGQLDVDGGALTIGMDKGAKGIWNVGGLSTIPLGQGTGNSIQYGRVEIRARTSEEVEGAGPCFLLWPSNNKDWPPEVDILETPKSGQGMFTNHWQGPGGNGDDKYKSFFFDLDHSEWHTYTLDWFPDRMDFYVDGQKLYTTTENIPKQPMSVGLQGHVGRADDGWYGSPNATGVNSVDIHVDWVRVSKFPGDALPVAAAPSEVPSQVPAAAPQPVTPAAMTLPAEPVAIPAPSAEDQVAADLMAGFVTSIAMPTALSPEGIPLAGAAQDLVFA